MNITSQLPRLRRGLDQTLTTKLLIDFFSVTWMDKFLSLNLNCCADQVNEGVREKENSDRLEWIQTHVQCDEVWSLLTPNCVKLIYMNAINIK